MRKQNAVLWAAGLGLAAGVSSCSSSHHGATGTSSTSVATPSSSGAGTSTTTSAGPAATTVATTAPASTASTAPAGPATCATSSLAASLTGANGTAGSVYYSLVLTNQGSTPCVMQGYPGVSFVTGSNGLQLGSPAGHPPASAPQFDLAAGASAHAVLQITDAGNYGSGCGMMATAGLRVYPPNQRAALFVAHADQGCSNPADVTLHVGPMQPPA